MLNRNFDFLSKVFYIHAIISLFLVLMSFSNPAKAYSASESDVSKMSQYISRVCKKECAEAINLLDAVIDAAREFKINPLTLLAIIGVESSYKPFAENKTIRKKKVVGRSVGLSQIQYNWHRDKFQTSDPFDVKDNIRVGARVYKDCVVRSKGDRSKALACYSGNTEYTRTKYVPKVVEVYNELLRFRFTFATL